MRQTSKLRMILELEVLALLITVGSCSGHRASEPHYMPAAEIISIQSPLPLPAPHDLRGLLDAPRRTSYIETDLIKDGEDFESLLPRNKVTTGSPTADFAPQWSVANGLTPANLAYCTYQFSIPGFDRAAEVRYGWDQAAAEVGTAWLGLANWSTDSWDWFTCNAGGVNAVPSFTPYINNTDTLLVIVLQANADLSRLRYIRLGPGVVEAQLTAGSRTGLAPLSVNFAATHSSTMVGTIELYQWDYDGDGNFETDTGTTATSSHVYASAGAANPAVRVVNSFGESGQASIDIHAVEPWLHSWGGDSQDNCRSVVFDGSDGIYAAGFTSSFGAGDEDVLLLKFSLAGELQWARAWGGADGDVANSLAIDADGNVLLGGYTESYGAGNSDFLLQKWDPDGNLLWTRTWGGSDLDSCTTIATRGEAIYLAGNGYSFGAGSEDAFIAKCNAGGDIEWARSWGGNYEDSISDMVASLNFLSETTELHLVGTTGSFGAGNYDIFYLRIGDDASLNSQYTWGDGERQYGSAITRRGALLNVSYFIAGQTWDGNNAPRRALVLEVTNSDPLAATWYADVNHTPMDILPAVSGGFLFCGRYDGGAGAELIKLSAAGAVESSEIIDAPDKFDELSALASVPSLGLLIGGTSGPAVEASWQPTSGNAGTSAISWQSASGSYASFAPITGSPAGIVTDITDGVLDAGAGGPDVLLALRPQP
jgi:PKD repeat protein